MDALSKHNKIALDLDGTLIGGGASHVLSQFVTQHPTKSFSIITFRTPEQATSIPAELQDVGLAADQFDNIVPMPVRYLIEFDEDQRFRRNSSLPRIESVPTEALLPGEYKLVHWKGYVAHRIGATVLVDDMPELAAAGCKKFGVELINVNQLASTTEGRTLTQVLKRLCEAAKTVFTLPPEIARHVEFVGDFDPDDRVAHIGSIVSSQKGYGRQAVAAFEQWARDQGAWKISGEAVTQSLPFWWKLGYRDRSRGERMIPIHKIL